MVEGVEPAFCAFFTAAWHFLFGVEGRCAMDGWERWGEGRERRDAMTLFFILLRKSKLQENDTFA